MDVADRAFLTEIDCNREFAADYPGVSSQLIINGLRDGDIISEDSIDKLSDELNSVICVMGCAPVETLMNSLIQFIQSQNRD